MSSFGLLGKVLSVLYESKKKRKNYFQKYLTNDCSFHLSIFRQNVIQIAQEN